MDETPAAGELLEILPSRPGLRMIDFQGVEAPFRFGLEDLSTRPLSAAFQQRIGSQPGRLYADAAVFRHCRFSTSLQFSLRRPCRYGNTEPRSAPIY